MSAPMGHRPAPTRDQDAPGYPLWNLFRFDQPDGGSGREPDGIRIGDAERDRAVSLLGEHFAAGRLDRAEYTDRADLALQAKLSSELDALFVDLPADPYAQNGFTENPYDEGDPYGEHLHGYGSRRPGELAPAAGRGRFPAPPPFFVLVPLVLGGLFLLSALMHAPWFLIGLIWLGVVLHHGRGPWGRRYGHQNWRGQRSRGSWPGERGNWPGERGDWREQRAQWRDFQRAGRRDRRR